MTNRILILHLKRTDMKNIILICLLIAFTGCSGTQIRTLCQKAGKKIANTCTSMTMKKRESLATAVAGDKNNDTQPKLQAPGSLSLLEWNEAVHVW